MASKYASQARIFKALGDENRLRILELLQSGEKCACKLLEDLNIQQSTLSHHMKILCDAGIVKGRKEGKWTHYELDPRGSQQTQLLLQQVLAVDDYHSNCCD